MLHPVSPVLKIYYEQKGFIYTERFFMY